MEAARNHETALVFEGSENLKKRHTTISHGYEMKNAAFKLESPTVLQNLAFQ